MSRWYRAYEGTAADPKLVEAALVADVSRAVAIAAWHCLLESAASVNNCGSFNTTARRVAAMLGEPIDRIEAVFAAFTEIGWISDCKIVAWRQHDPKSARLPYSDWVIVRAGIFDRDDYTCRYCGARGVKLECDHVLPVSRGGSNEKTNLVTACKPCNQKKRDRTPDEMGWSL